MKEITLDPIVVMEALVRGRTNFECFDPKDDKSFTQPSNGHIRIRRHIQVPWSHHEGAFGEKDTCSHHGKTPMEIVGTGATLDEALANFLLNACEVLRDD